MYNSLRFLYHAACVYFYIKGLVMVIRYKALVILLASASIHAADNGHGGCLTGGEKSGSGWL